MELSHLDPRLGREGRAPGVTWRRESELGRKECAGLVRRAQWHGLPRSQTNSRFGRAVQVEPLKAFYFTILYLRPELRPKVTYLENSNNTSDRSTIYLFFVLIDKIYNKSTVPTTKRTESFSRSSTKVVKESIWPTSTPVPPLGRFTVLFTLESFYLKFQFYRFPPLFCVCGGVVGSWRPTLFSRSGGRDVLRS